MKIYKRDREILRAMRDDEIDLRHNPRRRLRNALLALSRDDPQWMLWVERNITPRMKLWRIVRLVEARARILVLKHFGDMNRSCYYFKDVPFGDSGALKPG